jgi:hypothetical protein
MVGKGIAGLARLLVWISFAPQALALFVSRIGGIRQVWFARTLVCAAFLTLSIWIILNGPVAFRQLTLYCALVSSAAYLAIWFALEQARSIRLERASTMASAADIDAGGFAALSDLTRNATGVAVVTAAALLMYVALTVAASAGLGLTVQAFAMVSNYMAAHIPVVGPVLDEYGRHVPVINRIVTGSCKAGSAVCSGWPKVVILASVDIVIFTVLIPVINRLARQKTAAINHLIVSPNAVVALGDGMIPALRRVLETSYIPRQIENALEALAELGADGNRSAFAAAAEFARSSRARPASIEKVVRDIPRFWGGREGLRHDLLLELMESPVDSVAATAIRAAAAWVPELRDTVFRIAGHTRGAENRRVAAIMGLSVYSRMAGDQAPQTAAMARELEGPGSFGLRSAGAAALFLVSDTVDSSAAATLVQEVGYWGLGLRTMLVSALWQLWREGAYNHDDVAPAVGVYLETAQCLPTADFADVIGFCAWLPEEDIVAGATQLTFHQYPGVRQRGVHILGYYSGTDADVTLRLEEIAESDPDPYVRRDARMRRPPAPT